MAKRPDPATLALASYYLAFTSSFIVLAAFILGLRVFDAVAFLRHIIWLALITSAAGLFLAYAARSDFRQGEASPADERRARVGWRINLLTLVLMLLLIVLVIVSTVLPGAPF